MRLTRTHRKRISNRLAVLAAFLLVAATAASLNGSMARAVDAGPSVAGSSQAAEQAAQAPELGSVKSNRSFKFRLHLFRRN
jgi:hypothetical protein